MVGFAILIAVPATSSFAAPGVIVFQLLDCGPVGGPGSLLQVVIQPDACTGTCPTLSVTVPGNTNATTTITNLITQINLTGGGNFTALNAGPTGIIINTSNTGYSVVPCDPVAQICFAPDNCDLGKKFVFTAGIPTLSEAGLVLLVLVLTGTGIALIVRRH